MLTRREQMIAAADRLGREYSYLKLQALMVPGRPPHNDARYVLLDEAYQYLTWADELREEPAR